MRGAQIIINFFIFYDSSPSQRRNRNNLHWLKIVLPTIDGISFSPQSSLSVQELIVFLGINHTHTHTSAKGCNYKKYSGPESDLPIVYLWEGKSETAIEKFMKCPKIRKTYLVKSIALFAVGLSLPTKNDLNRPSPRSVLAKNKILRLNLKISKPISR